MPESQEKIETSIAALWKEVDSTDWRKRYRGIIPIIAKERGMDRQNVWRALRVTRTIEIGVRALQLKRERDKEIKRALKSINIPV